jgi:hypothetical protein
MLLIFVRRDDLHPPEAGKQYAKTARQHQRDQAELRFVLF